MNSRIVAVSDQPELAALVAQWRVDTFHGGHTVEELTALILAPPAGPEENFVLFDDDQPVGTAGLAPYDLPTRPDLSPWLVGVFVQPAFRGRGHATTLVRRVESFAQAASVAELWLYTAAAETLYASLGWQRVGLEQDGGQPVVLMRRWLSQEPDPRRPAA
jgi:GNAT superfamily N-acetyltransferase